jgi:amidohydrolase
MRISLTYIFSNLFFFCSLSANCQTFQNLNKHVELELNKVISWRRVLHQKPELSNREFYTSQFVAEHLKAMGIETELNVAKTGVIGVLKGAKPGPVMALRADMDALPLYEKNNLIYKSTDSGYFNGVKVPVMHACGHDAHTAILMGVAEILSKLKDEIKGTVVFIFQPAEESPPPGEEGGAQLMVKEGVLKRYKIEAIFGLHISSTIPVGELHYKGGPVMASADIFKIIVKGKSTHGANPWNGIDPIYISSQIIESLQSIVSRESDLTKAPVVISVGILNAGVRFNIIPEFAEIIGTVRNLDERQQDKVLEQIKYKSELISRTYGGSAEVVIEKKYPITFNNVSLTKQLLPSLQYAVGNNFVKEQNWTTISEDFSFFQREIPGFFFFIGGMSPITSKENAPGHHSSEFMIDDSRLDVGLKAFCQLIYDYPNLKTK